MEKLPTIAIIGGTGKLGQGLAYQLAKRGYPIVIGSREAGPGADPALGTRRFPGPPCPCLQLHSENPMR